MGGSGCGPINLARVRSTRAGVAEGGVGVTSQNSRKPTNKILSEFCMDIQFHYVTSPQGEEEGADQEGFRKVGNFDRFFLSDEQKTFFGDTQQAIYVSLRLNACMCVQGYYVCIIRAG